MRKWWRTILFTAILATATLGGCINYEEEITLNEDGSGTLTMHYSIEESMVEMMEGMTEGMEEMEGMEMTAEMPFALDEAGVKEQFSSCPQKPRDVQVYSKDGERHIVVTFDFRHVNEIPDSVLEGREITVTKDKDGFLNYHTSFVLEEDISQAGNFSGQTDELQEIQLALAAMMADAKVTELDNPGAGFYIELITEADVQSVTANGGSHSLATYLSPGSTPFNQAYDISLDGEVTASNEGMNGMTNGTDIMGDQMAEAMFSQYTFKFALNMPTDIIEASPGSTIEGNMVTWEFPLISLGGDEIEMTARAKASDSNPWKLYAIIGAGILGLAAAVAIGLLIIRKRDEGPLYGNITFE